MELICACPRRPTSAASSSSARRPASCMGWCARKVPYLDHDEPLTDHIEKPSPPCSKAAKLLEAVPDAGREAYDW